LDERLHEHQTVTINLPSSGAPMRLREFEATVISLSTRPRRRALVERPLDIAQRSRAGAGVTGSARSVAWTIAP
jgi:hypothetical protein